MINLHKRAVVHGWTVKHLKPSATAFCSGAYLQCFKHQPSAVLYFSKCNMSGADTASVLQQPGVMQKLTLKDGRCVSISVCGDPQGRPVLFFHPIQGNRHMPLILHKAASALQLRIIALDRPGIGLSSQQPGRLVKHYPKDVAEVCEQLGIDTCSIMASSAGTMYALACTVAPETKDKIVGKVTLIAPWIPSSSRQQRSFGGVLHFLGSWVPVPLLHHFVGFTNGRIVQQSRSRPVTELMTRSNDQEKAAFAADAGNDAIYKAMIHEWTNSLAGIIQEMQLCTERTAPLHFSYTQDVTAPVRVYQGTADQMLQRCHVEHWAQQASNVELISVPGGTHDGLMHTHKDAALQALAADLESS